MTTRLRTALLPSALTSLCLAATLACGDTGQGGKGSPDVVLRAPQALGHACIADEECISRVCLESQYGTPFCSRPCTTPWEPCAGGDDAADGKALCISFEDRPNPSAPAFEGDLSRFCVLRCSDVDECTALEPAWEACEPPQWLGDLLYPQLGNAGVCQSPSFHGKEPVDPTTCDWERTIKPQFTNHANLCKAYCDYLSRCKELPVDDQGLARLDCCAWGCYNQMVIEDVVQDPWYDEIRCYIENHAAFPPEGPKNACTEPPKNCGGDPEDPTPPAARP